MPRTHFAGKSKTFPKRKCRLGGPKASGDSLDGVTGRFRRSSARAGLANVLPPLAWRKAHALLRVLRVGVRGIGKCGRVRYFVRAGLVNEMALVGNRGLQRTARPTSLISQRLT